MHTVQHPFFLSSAKGSNRSTDGSTFTVKLDRPLKIPREALHTRVYCNQASAIYAFPNVSAALTANVLSLFYEDHTAHGAAAVEYRLVIPEGLYANLDAVQEALGTAAVEQQVPGVTDAASFKNNILELSANTATSRVRLHIKSQNFTVRVDPDGDGSDLLTDLLGFTRAQTSQSSSSGGLLTPKVEGWIAKAENMSGYSGKTPIEFEWTDSGVQRQSVSIESHTYTPTGLINAINEQIAAGNWASESPIPPGGTNLRVASITPSGPNTIGPTTFGADSVAVTFTGNGGTAIALTTVTDMSAMLRWGTAVSWAYHATGDTTKYEAALPGRLDKVQSLQIGVPGLTSGVHINDESGSSTICRFPINTAPGGLIQFDPVDPIKSAHDMSGNSIQSFRVELLDQNGAPVDTAGESYNCTIVVEYELAAGTKISG